MRAPPSPAPGHATLLPGEDEMDIGSIDLGERAGRNLGDLGPLMASIAAEGLHYPITAGPTGRLILGRRRLEACRRLGWRRIPAETITTVQEALDRIRRDAQNVQCVHPLTVAEAIGIDLALRELQWWPRDGSTATAGRRDLRREEMARALGLNGSQYGAARELVLAARGYRPLRGGGQQRIPAEEQARAREALALIRRPSDLKAAQRLYRTGASEWPPAPSHGPRRLPSRSQEDSVSAALAALGGIIAGLSTAMPLDTGIPSDVIKRWGHRADETLGVLQRFRKELRRYGYGDGTSNH